MAKSKEEPGSRGKPSLTASSRVRSRRRSERSPKIRSSRQTRRARRRRPRNARTPSSVRPGHHPTGRVLPVRGLGATLDAIRSGTRSGGADPEVACASGAPSPPETSKSRCPGPSGHAPLSGIPSPRRSILQTTSRAPQVGKNPPSGEWVLLATTTTCGGTCRPRRNVS